MWFGFLREVWGGGGLVVIFFSFKSKTFSSSKTVSSNIITECDYTQRKTTRGKLRDFTELSYQQKLKKKNTNRESRFYTEVKQNHVGKRH